jgi:benzoylformate decarboxylase
LAEALMDTNTGRFALVRQLLADGIHCMFGNPGTSEQNLLDALGDEEFRDFTYYLALHEGTAVAMGDGYARALQRPAVVQLHSYAGLANGLGMMKYAHRGYTPMVVIAGDAGLKYDALDGQMAADLVNMARPFVKSDHNGPCSWRVVDAGSLLRLLRRALKTAATPPMGPVFLALPMDILDAVNAEPVVPTSRIDTRVAPSPESIAQAAALLAEAKAPLILMGDAVAASGAQAELAEVAELLGAVVWGVNCSEVNLPSSHPLFGGFTGHMFGEDSRPITSGADVVLICGTTVMPEVFPALEGVFAEGAAVIHFDLNVTEIAKNFPVRIGALGDPQRSLALLAAEIKCIMSPAQQAAAEARLNRQCEAKAAQREKSVTHDAGIRDQVPLAASRFMEELGNRLPEDALIFDEALTNSPALCRYLPQDRPGTYFQTRAGMLGTGLPGALGLKVAHPDKVVFGFSGDGGSISTIQALGTAARHGIGVKFVVCNNRSYRILKYNLQRYWADLPPHPQRKFPESFDLSTPELRFDLLAEGQGVAAIRVERPEEIAPALDRAFADDRPLLIELMLSADL